MKEFGDKLGILPHKFPISRFKQFESYKYHTAIFEKNFVFVYQIKGEKIYICNIIRTSRLK